MTVRTDLHNANAAQARDITERSVEAWRHGARLVAQQAGVLSPLPKIDLTEPVARYFDYVQQVVDFNRDLATRWAQLVGTVTRTAREQAVRVGGVVTEQVGAVADVATGQARRAEGLANEQAGKAQEAARQQEREIKRAERAAAKQSREAAREPYEGLSKAELSDQLVERGLPKTGTVDELIERLVGADSE